MKAFLKALLFCLLAGNLARAEETKSERPSIFDPDSFEIRPEGHVRIYFDPSANEGVYDRAFVAGVTLSSFEALNFAAGELIWGQNPKEQTPLERIVRSLGSAIPLILIEIPINGAAHEYGHFRGYNLAGMKDPMFLSSTDGKTFYYADPGVAYRGIALQSFRSGEFMYASQSPTEVSKFKKDPKRQRYEALYNAFIDGDGLNQEQYNAEIVALKALRGKAHPLDAVPYFICSSGTIGYAMSGGDGDISEYVLSLNRAGIKTSVSQIRVVSQVPKLVSNSTISFVIAWFDYWITGDDAVEPLAVKFGDLRVNWPDFYSYLTLHGPTIKGVERVSWRNYAMHLSYEHSLADGSREGGAMLEGNIFKWLSASLEGVRNFSTGGVWLEAEVALRPLALFGEHEALRWLEFGAKGYYGRGDTFRREIVGPSLHIEEEKTTGVKWFVGANIPF